jgi:hypothetical protein
MGSSVCPERSSRHRDQRPDTDRNKAEGQTTDQPQPSVLVGRPQGSARIRPVTMPTRIHGASLA